MPPICDYDYRERMKGSLDYIRFHEICKPVLSGHKEKSDEKGTVYFQNFMVERGPQAAYTLRYRIEINDFTEILSDTFEFYASSEITELESLNGNSLLNYEKLNQPLDPQPQVRITDVNGLPIKGKRVLAFSWVEPIFYTFMGERNSPSNGKYFEFENYISELSDDNGVARFTNLIVVGSAENLAYIHFY